MPRGRKPKNPVPQAAQMVAADSQQASTDPVELPAEQEEDMDDDLPLANLDMMDEQGLLIYGIRNLNIDMSGQSAEQMRDTLKNQIGRHRAGFRMI